MEKIITLNYLIYSALTNFGNILVQEMILLTFGHNKENKINSYFISFKPKIKRHD